MPGETKIEWTQGDDGSKGATWNPVTGCTKVSAGCDHCYAERFAERFRGVPGHAYEQGFDLKLWPERLDLPLRWTRPRRVFVNSMSDLFHAGVPEAFIWQVFAVMSSAQQHTFQILTKRPQRMRRVLSQEDWFDRLEEAAEEVAGRKGWCHLNITDDLTWPLPNVWLGVSVERQDVAFRIDYLADTPAAVRFLSCEPLIGPLDLTQWLFPVKRLHTKAPLSADPGASLVDWVITGGESGPGFRPLELDWVRDLRDQCVLARVPFFFKQVGGIRPKAGGRDLDGRTWDEFPAVIAS